MKEYSLRMLILLITFLCISSLEPFIVAAESDDGLPKNRRGYILSNPTNLPFRQISPLSPEGGNIAIRRVGGTFSHFWAVGEGGSFYSLARNAHKKNSSWQKQYESVNSFSVSQISRKEPPVMCLVQSEGAGAGRVYMSRLERRPEGLFQKHLISLNQMFDVCNNSKHALGLYKGSLFYYPHPVTSQAQAVWHEIPAPDGLAYTDISMGPNEAIARLQSKSNPAEISFVRFNMKEMREKETMRPPEPFETPAPFFSIALCPNQKGLIAGITAENGGYLYVSHDGGKNYTLIGYSDAIYRHVAIPDWGTLLAVDMQGRVWAFDLSVKQKNAARISLTAKKVKGTMVKNENGALKNEKSEGVKSDDDNGGASSVSIPKAEEGIIPNDKNEIAYGYPKGKPELPKPNPKAASPEILINSSNPKTRPQTFSAPKPPKKETPIFIKAFLSRVNESTPDYHEILGVNEGASSEAIESAYKKIHDQMKLNYDEDNADCKKAMSWLEKSYETLKAATQPSSN